jgi:outer membrane protein TolC
MQRVHHLTAAVLSIMLWTAAGGWAAEAPPAIYRIPAGLQDLIDTGLRENNQIQSLRDEVRSLKEAVPLAGSLDDPRLGFGVLNLPADTFDFDQEPMTQKMISLSQKFPWFGKLDLKSRRAVLAAMRQQARLKAQQQELARMIAEDYFELAFVVQSLEINEKLTDILARLLRVTETRYATGQGLQQDVLQAQVEMSRLLEEEIRLQQSRRTLQDRINAALNHDVFVSIEPNTAILPESDPHNAERLTDIGRRFNPGLKIRRAEIHLADLDVELARKDYWPDMDVRLAYGQRDKDRTGRDLPDFVSATVTVNLPVWQSKRQDSRVESMLARQKAAEKSYRNLSRRLPHQVHALVTEIARTRENYDLYRKALVTQAKHWAASSLSAYETDKIDFATMIDAQMRVLRFEQQALRYRKIVLQRQAELAELTGTLVPPVRDDGRKGESSAE